MKTKNEQKYLSTLGVDKTDYENEKTIMNSQGHVISIKHAYQDHQQRQKGLSLCKALIELIIDIQKHRGCTLAILSGDHFFETQLFAIQRDITDGLQRVQSIRSDFLSQAESEQILGEWISIRRQWHKDSVQENFLLHSNLINELSKHVWQVVERSHQLHISKTQDQLLALSLRDWLHIMEISAQTRGLATHIAVCRDGDPGLISRLGFLSRQMDELNQASLYAARQIDERVASKITKAREKSKYDHHFRAFQTALATHFIDASEGMDADTIYTLGSHVVSASHQVLLAGMKQIERAISPELSAWINGELD